MCDDDIPALSDHLSDMYRCFTHSIKLVGNALMGFVFDERVTANGDNCKLSHSFCLHNKCSPTVTPCGRLVTWPPGTTGALRKNQRIVQPRQQVPGPERYAPNVPRQGQSQSRGYLPCPSSRWHWSKIPTCLFSPDVRSSFQRWFCLP